MWFSRKMLVTKILSALLLWRGYRNNRRLLVVLYSKIVSGLRKIQVKSANVSGIRKSKRNLFITELAYEQLKARARIHIYSKAKFKKQQSNFYHRNPQTNHKTFTKSVDSIF